MDRKYRTQFELEKEPISIMKVAEDPIAFEKSVTFEYKSTKPRAIKKCEICDIKMLSSSHARHVKSKAHLKSILLTHFLS